MTRRRRSKVRSKTRSESSQKSEDIVYCVCRSSDGTRFMIACDNCEEWYHGDCINVTPKQAANIKRFFCHLCVGRNPSLEIEYKTGKEERVRLPNLRQQIKKTNLSEDDENDADLSSSSSPNKSPGLTKKALRKRWRSSISESVEQKRRGRPKERQEDYDDEATEDEIETSGYIQSTEDNVEGEYCGHVYRGRGQISTNHGTLTNTPKGCGVCEGCKVLNDCGHCDTCTRYGSSPKSICSKRRCLNSSYRNHIRKTFVSKSYGIINDDNFNEVVEHPENHRSGNARRRNNFEIREIRQRITNSAPTTKNSCAVGSKMRRGDHLPGGGNSITQKRSLTNVGLPYKCYGEESLEVINGSSFRYQNKGFNNSLSRNQPTIAARLSRTESDYAAAAHMSSNTSSISERMSSHQYPDECQYAEESEEDVMIPNELLSPANGRRFLKETYSKTEYGLNYPDHLYCKHHRSFNSHDTALSSSDLVISASCRTEVSTKSDQDLELRPPSPGQHFVVIDRPMKTGNTRLTPNQNLRHNRKLSSTKISHGSSEKRLAMSSESSVGTTASHISRLFSDQSYQMIDLNEPIMMQSTSNMIKMPKSITDSSPSHSTASLFLSSTIPSNHNHHTAQDFYTINDEDDLEINWPKDTVNV